MEKGYVMSILNVVDLLKAVQVFEKKIAVALMYSGLRMPQFRLLDLLDNCEEATVTEMSKRMGVSRATTSVMINELVRAAVVSVGENPSDRRSFHIRLTEIGRNKLNVARSDMAVMQDKIASKYSMRHLGCSTSSRIKCCIRGSSEAKWGKSGQIFIITSALAGKSAREKVGR
jgi:DNA-binding MarR family transcriptional regulator